jgi:hypothetical protein
MSLRIEAGKFSAAAYNTATTVFVRKMLEKPIISTRSCSDFVREAIDGLQPGMKIGPGCVYGA